MDRYPLGGSDFIEDMMDIITRPSKNYVRAKNEEVVDFYVEWPMMEEYDDGIFLDLIDYFGLNEYLIEDKESLIDILSDKGVPEGAYYESDGDLEDYPNDYKYKTRIY